MICKGSQYINFRNIECETLIFDKGINLILGDNAQGKTNALEGIFLCAQGRSHRSSKERDFIKFGSDFASVKVDYADSRRDDCSLYIRYLSSGRKCCMKNSVPIGRMSEFIGNFRAILFTPEHLGIVKDGPSERRKFTDCALSQLYTSYVCDLQSYNKILMQRNKLLSESYGSDMRAFSETVGIWSEQLAAYAERISSARQSYLERLSVIAADIFSDMTSGKEKLSIEYEGARTKEEYLSLLTENLDKEIRYKTTLYGVHKDDIGIYVDSNRARSFGSQGQQRSASLAMKIAEGEISKMITGEYPVFLFDDIFSELDRHRREYIVKGMNDRQVIITACEDKEQQLFRSSHRIFCKNGRFYT